GIGQASARRLRVSPRDRVPRLPAADHHPQGAPGRAQAARAAREGPLTPRARRRPPGWNGRRVLSRILASFATPCLTAPAGGCIPGRSKMRHYEIVLLVHPDQSEQVGAMVDRYRAVVEENGGTVHRQEDWGRRQLAYPIEKIHKAHYLLFNIECDAAVLDQLKNMFKFSDAVIRNLVVRMDRAVTDSSPMMREAESEEGAERGARESRADSDD